MASSAKSALATELRILTQTVGTGGIDTVSVGAAGTGYVALEVLTLVGGASDGTITVLTVGGGGEVLTISRKAPGTGYAVAAGLATTGGSGSNCTIDVDTLLYRIAELQNIGGPGGRLNMIDVTNHQSPSGAEEVIAGVLVGGEVALEGNFVNDASQAMAKTDHQGKTLRNYELYVPLATPVTWTFSGFFNSLDYSARYEEKLGFSGAIKTTGLPNLG